MNKTILVLLASILIGLFGCSLLVNDPEGGGDADTDVDSDTDGDSDGDSDIDTSAIVIPDAPTVTSPVEGARIVNPLEVEGEGEPGDTVSVELYASGDLLESGQATVGDDGRYSVVLDTFTHPPIGTSLTLEITQENEAGASPKTEVNLKYDPVVVSGTVTGLPEPGPIRKLHVRLYTNGEDYVNHAQQLEFNVPGGAGDFNIPYQFQVGDGEYYVRAFVDKFGGCTRNGCGGPPDGQPTISPNFTDPQAPAEGPISVTPSTPNLVNVNQMRAEIEPITQILVHQFEVYTFNETATPQVPEWEDSFGNPRPGDGFCRGYHMKAQAMIERLWEQEGQKNPMVRLPGGNVVELLDDGGCSTYIADNTLSSYDNGKDDEEYSFGWQSPNDEDAGEYVLFAKDEFFDLIHLQVDRIDVVQKLSRGMKLLSPTAEDCHLANNRYYRWRAVPGARSYKVNTEETGAGYYLWLDHTAYTPDGPDEYHYNHVGPAGFDDVPFSIWVQSMDLDPLVPESDLDAMAESERYYFVVDDDGADAAILTGSVRNDSGEEDAEIHLDLQIRMNNGTSPWDGGHSTVILPPGAVIPYDMAYLSSPMIIEYELNGFIDVDGSGDPYSPVNRHYHARTNSQATTVVPPNPAWPDLRFGPPLRILEPALGAMDVPTQPQFQWEKLENTPAGAWCYVLVTEPKNSVGGGEDGPSTVIAIPGDATGYSLGAPDESLDVLDARSSGDQQSKTILNPGEEHTWSLLAVECAYPFNSADIPEFLSCSQALFDNQGVGAWASSPEFRYFTQK